MQFLKVLAALTWALHTASAFNPSTPRMSPSRGRPCHSRSAKHAMQQSEESDAGTISAPPSRRSVTGTGLPIADVAPDPVDDEENFEKFAKWFAERLAEEPVSQQYPELFADVCTCVLRWRHRYRGNKPLWRKLMKADKVIKEIAEAAPVLSAVRDVVNAGAPGERFTIIDLCSGKGFLSMILSEMLPKERVDRCILVDKAWPPRDWEGPIREHHTSSEHIYGYNSQGTQYFDTWPIPLHVLKQDLKRVHANNLHKAIEASPGPVLLVAIHLCGTLALKAVNHFNDYKQVRFFALKPCCLPSIQMAYNGEQFHIGNHTFPASAVAAAGRWGKGGVWVGTPRERMKKRFERWTAHLFRGVEVSASNGTKAIHFCRLQFKGGYQNLFIFAERGPRLSLPWDRLRQSLNETVQHVKVVRAILGS